MKKRSDVLKKGIKFSLCIMGIGIVLAALGWGLISTLKHNGLMFRAWVGITFFVIMMLLGLALIGGIVYTLVKVYSRPEEQPIKRIAQKVLSAIGIIAVLFSSCVLGLYVFIIVIFVYQPEHGVVEKYGQKMVVYLEVGYNDIYVRYYEYKNFMVCGYPRLGFEWYDGDSNPFKRDPVPEPKNYTFYDTQGNIIAQSERQRGAAQENPDSSGIDNQTESSAFPPKKMQCIFSASDEKAFCEMQYSVDGENWKVIDTGYHYQFLFEDAGVLVFSYDWAIQQEVAAIYKSDDGGGSWTFVSDTPIDKPLQNTVFFDKDTGIFEYGIAGTDNYILYITTDGAKTFRKPDLPIELQGQVDRIKEYINAAR